MNRTSRIGLGIFLMGLYLLDDVNSLSRVVSFVIGWLLVDLCYWLWDKRSANG